jgi:hypothetical protein
VGRASLDMVDGGVTTRAPRRPVAAAGRFGRMGAALKTGWLKFAWVLARINTAILLTVIYFLIVAPTNLMLRITRADPLARRIGDEPSFWQAPEHPCDDLEACRKQF